MKKAKIINFLQEDKEEEKIFKLIVIILIYLLVFKCYTDINLINNLKDEINSVKIQYTKNSSLKESNTKSTLIQDTKLVYDLLGYSNVDRLCFENNKMKIEGKCKKLKKLDELRNMDNIRNFSITNVENKNDKFYFQAVYEIGGLD